MIFARNTHDIAREFHCSMVEAPSDVCTGHKVFDKFTHLYDNLNSFVWIVPYFFQRRLLLMTGSSTTIHTLT